MSATRYQGGKNGAGVFQTIINCIPRHEVYVEAFAGSAAVFRNKRRAARSILIERDSDQVRRLLELASPGVTILQGDALQLLQDLIAERGDVAGVFAYLDPPYHHSARRDLDLYRHELTDAQHHQLLHSITCGGGRPPSKPASLEVRR